MSKNLKGILVVVGVGALVFGGLYMLKNRKRFYARSIVKDGGHASLSTILEFDEAFLKAWSVALNKGSEKFTYKEKMYFTKGGKAAQ